MQTITCHICGDSIDYYPALIEKLGQGQIEDHESYVLDLHDFLTLQLGEHWYNSLGYNTLAGPAPFAAVLHEYV